MRIQSIIVSVLALLLVGTAACQKLDAPAGASPRTVTLDAIPQDMGDLFAVTSAPNWPSNAQLWFQKPDKTITMVAVNMKTNRLSNTTVLIPRR